MKPTLVLGASLKPYRVSNQAIFRLRSSGYTVYALGLREGRVADVEIRKNFETMGGPRIHTITMYMNARRQVDFYDLILNSGANRVIFNPGSENHELYRMLLEKGIEAENACTLVLLSLGQY